MGQDQARLYLGALAVVVAAALVELLQECHLVPAVVVEVVVSFLEVNRGLAVLVAKGLLNKKIQATPTVQQVEVVREAQPMALPAAMAVDEAMVVAAVIPALLVLVAPVAMARSQAVVEAAVGPV
jgi:hypothetical protein